MNISNDNYELWLLRYAEQELNADERAEVEQWLAANPEAANELALYGEAPRLERDEHVHYTAAMPQHSQSLWPIALRWAAAAAVVAILMVPAMQQVVAPRIVSNEPILIAQAEPPAIKETPNNQIINESHNTHKPLENTTNPESLDNLANLEPLEQLDSIEPIETTKNSANLIYVDNLIVFEDEPEAPVDYAAAEEVIYTNTENNINPIGHFISTFIKANK